MISPLRLALLTSALLLTGCSTPDPEGRLDAVAWFRTSAERDALCRQAFAVATATLDRALADPHWTACAEQGPVLAGKPPAVICDVDDTLLDISDFCREELLHELDDQPSFDDWALRADAPALPGALDFVQAATAKGIVVFYVTNRNLEVHGATRQNLAEQGFPLREDFETLLCMSDNPDKGPRRAAIAHDYRILMLVGDSGGDFSSTFLYVTPEERVAAADRNKLFWGERWVVLPNPVYGDWKRSILGWKDVPIEDQDDELLDYLAELPAAP